MKVRWFSFYLAEHFLLREFSSAVDALRLANQVLGTDAYRWRVLSSDGRPVVSSCGICLTPDASIVVERDRLALAQRPDMVVVCGGSTPPQNSSELDAWIRECRFRGIAVAGLAGGSFALARAGVLYGRKCAVHWSLHPKFSQEFPGIEASRTLFETDDNIHTSAGGSATFDMFLQIVGNIHGCRVTGRVCELALSDRMRMSGENQPRRKTLLPEPGHALVGEVVAKMEESLASPLPLTQLSALCGYSRRQLERLFVRETGKSPARYYMDMRLERAHLLLSEATLSIADIAVACGFASTAYFSRAFRQVYGQTPQKIRQTSPGRGARRSSAA